MMPRGRAMVPVWAAATGLALLAGVPSGAHGASAPELVNCYDPARGLVQRMVPSACTGEIVDESRAEEIDRDRRQARAARFRATEQKREELKRAHRSGSAVFVSDDGYLVTAKHVVDGCRAVTVQLPDARATAAEVVRMAADTDLALLKVDHAPLAIVELAPLPGGSPNADLSKGIREATAIGFPSLGRVVIRPVSTRAPVLGTRPLPPSPVPRLVLQARVHPGNSGGPVVDSEGRLIGILIAKLDRSAVFARVGELPPDMAIAETGRSVAALMDAAEVSVTPIGGPGRGLQDALGASVRVECQP
ncbi:S1C family serine protease [Rhodovibrio salinarum]|uniref:Serine protease n=1 Tax=Rhodovibrio salinarum TaxID=1087 RepID=A0A934QFU8_9PROT|nr:serine protease [Rhodovibrio salinarum]MBK1696009.1 serine protease [Rhodovibrio salinarum]